MAGRFALSFCTLTRELARQITRTATEKGKAEAEVVSEDDICNTCTALERSASVGVAAGIVDRRWSVSELISYPLP